MGYIHIDNLYKSQDILLFRECYALEKVHGTSTCIKLRGKQLSFHSGGCSYEAFKSLFDEEELLKRLLSYGYDSVDIHGEGYGGKMQGMREVYGESLRFIAFDIKVDDVWLNVPNMDDFARNLGLDVVPWVKIPTTLGAIDAERDRPSQVAAANGCGEDKPREGVVLRPLVEVRKNNDVRVIAKHKQEAFSERATPQKVVNPEKLKVLEEAAAIAQEWVTEMRLTHVLDKFSDPCVEHTGQVVKAMVEDVLREAEREIVVSRDAKKAIGRRAAQLFHLRLKSNLK